MILVIGEILVDMIGKEGNTSIETIGKLGGAPLNVASDLSDLGEQVVFHGIIGDDLLGTFIEKQCKKMEGNICFDLKKRKDRQTTIAFFLKSSNEFQFLRTCGADFDFKKEELLSLPYQEASIIHFGSLFLSDRKARDTVFSLLPLLKTAGKKISFDVNFRRDIFREEEDYLTYYREMISYTDILKVTKEELLMLTEESTIEKALQKFPHQELILITDGEKGSYANYHGKLYSMPTKKVTPINTIGCGDSFMAGCLSYLSEHEGTELNNDMILSMLKRGNNCGAKTCLVTGALHGYHSKKEVDQ